jgi:hypothetical protein
MSDKTTTFAPALTQIVRFEDGSWMTLSEWIWHLKQSGLHDKARQYQERER